MFDLNATRDTPLPGLVSSRCLSNITPAYRLALLSLGATETERFVQSTPRPSEVVRHHVASTWQFHAVRGPQRAASFIAASQARSSRLFFDTNRCCQHSVRASQLAHVPLILNVLR
jgi:hypothetical protein